MIFYALSAAAVGLLHSILSPGHWLPVALMQKSRKWSRGTAMLGAIVAASGHILLSTVLALFGIVLGAQVFHRYQEAIESRAGILLILFGLVYAGWSFWRHSSCAHHDHSHHGPRYEKSAKGPFIFLFSIGMAPCVAVFPVFAAAATEGAAAIISATLGFAVGVVSAFITATWLASLGVRQLDHPWIEHYGDVITGVTVALMGVILLFLPHHH